MNKITFLGPVGATFSHDAYNSLAKRFDAPEVTDSKENSNCVPAAANGEILPLICNHGGYGAIAMETLAEGRVAEPLESFIDLLKRYKKTTDCPFWVAGAIRMRLNFCLMTRHDMPLDLIKHVIAHPKAIGACKERIAVMNLSNTAAASNGEAARLVAENPEYARYAALGPKSAAEKYGLRIMEPAFEDREAVTTFFLITPTSHPVSVGKENRALIVFRTPHKPGALVKALQPFDHYGLNLIQIHSVHAGNHTYHFAIEIEVKENEQFHFVHAMAMFRNYVDEHLLFGPFHVVST